MNLNPDKVRAKLESCLRTEDSYTADGRPTGRIKEFSCNLVRPDGRVVDVRYTTSTVRASDITLIKMVFGIMQEAIHIRPYTEDAIFVNFVYVENEQ